MIDLIKDFIHYGSGIALLLAIGSYTYLFPIYYFFLVKSLDRHYLSTQTLQHPIFPKSTLLRMMFYCSSIVFKKWTIKNSLNDQFFGADHPRNHCNKFQIILAYWCAITLFLFGIFLFAFLIYEFVIAPVFGIPPIFTN